MEKLFDNVKFGDKFIVENKEFGATDVGIVTSIRLKAGFVHIAFDPRPLYCEKKGCKIVLSLEGYYDIETGKRICKDGKTLNDNICVISKYEEPIDEKKLNKIATEAVSEFKGSGFDWSTGENYLTYEDKIKLYKKGYRKAKEE